MDPTHPSERRPDAPHDHPDAGPKRSIKPWLLAAAAVLALVGLVALSLNAANRRPVRLVSGVNAPYAVAINGQRHELGPYEQKTIKIAEGTHTFRVIADPDSPAAQGQAPALPRVAAPGGDQTFTVTGGLVGRLFGDDALMLNPDGSATLYIETASYGNAAVRDDELIAPAFFHTVDDVQHIFSDPPNATDAGLGGGATKRVLRQWTTNDFREVHEAVHDNFGGEAADELVVRRYLLEGGMHAEQVHGELAAGGAITPPLPEKPDPRLQPDRYVAPRVTPRTQAESDAQVEAMRAERDRRLSARPGRPAPIAPSPSPVSIFNQGDDNAASETTTPDPASEAAVEEAADTAP